LPGFRRRGGEKISPPPGRMKRACGGVAHAPGLGRGANVIRIFLSAFSNASRNSSSSRTADRAMSLYPPRRGVTETSKSQSRNCSDVGGGAVSLTTTARATFSLGVSSVLQIFCGEGPDKGPVSAKAEKIIRFSCGMSALSQGKRESTPFNLVPNVDNRNR
jgi:hypothetical protein